MDGVPFLLPQHVTLLKASGISTEVAIGRGYKSATEKTTLARYGFSKSQQLVPGLLLPVHDVGGTLRFYQYRPDTPRRNGDGKPNKYETPAKVRMAVDAHPIIRADLGNPTVPLFLTEGVRKADAAISRGLCCVDILGVWNWRGTNEDGGLTALPDWESIAMNGRRVYIVFDSDVMVKSQVHAALVRLKRFLESRGADVRPIYLPGGENGGKVGLDDYLAAGHTADDLLALATTEIRTPNAPRSDEAPITLTVMTAKALCELSDPETQDSLLGPLLWRRARTLVGAHTGQGKTTMALQMVKSAVTGTSFLDWQGAGKCRALVIDGEQGMRSIKRELREAGLDQSEDVDYLRVPDGLSLDKNAAEVNALEATFFFGQYDLVFADPLYKLHTGDSNAEREAVDLMRLFDRWRERYGFAFMAAMHTRKPPPIGARFTMHEFFGSSAYLRGAEVVLGLQYVRPGASRLYFFKDRDGDLSVGTRWSLLFTRKDGFTRDPDDGKKPNAFEKVRDILLGDPEITNEALATATGLKPETVRKARRKLADAAQSRALLDEPEDP